MEAHIGIKQDHISDVAKSLSHLLADEFVLYTKTRNAHWNVEGYDFHSMHLFFEQQYELLDEVIDAVAERIRVLGHYAPGTLRAFIALTHLAEASREENDSRGFITALLRDHESIIKLLRSQIDRFAREYNDVGTSDFITGLMESHEKMAWKLRAHFP